MKAVGSVFNRFQIIGVAIEAPDYEASTLLVEFEGISGNVIFGNHASFASRRKIRQGSRVVIEGHISAMFDSTGDLFPVADVIGVL